MKNIRAKSVCLFRCQERILLAEGFDPATNEHYLMPIGGGIEFGETSEQAAKREVEEEIGAQAHQFRLLGVFENLFSFNGEAGHEVVFVYEAQFTDEQLYHKSEFHGIETNGLEFNVRWFDKALIQSGTINVYPEGIARLL